MNSEGGRWDFGDGHDERDAQNNALNNKSAMEFWSCGCAPTLLATLLCIWGAYVPVGNNVVKEALRWGGASVLVTIGAVYFIQTWKNRNNP